MTTCRHLRPALLALLLAIVPAAYAQSDELPKKEISEKTSAGFARLRPLLDAKDHAAALTLVRALAAEARPGSFDLYVLSQIEAQILLTQNQLAAAVAPLERTLALADGNPAFFEPAPVLELLQLLAQLRYQLAAEAKTPAERRPGYEQALAYAERWLTLHTGPAGDMRALAASLHYTIATLDEKPDAARLGLALEQTREALLARPALHPQTLLLEIACHLQLGQNLAAAERLELLAEREPNNASTWSQLQAIYLGAAAEQKAPAEAARLNLRALHTLRRAQTHGHLATPKDHYTVVAILFNLQHYGRAAELLEKGLADGTLENDKRNWELLVSAYQQTHRLDLARSALERAVAKFPDDGTLEFTFAQFLQQMGDMDAAYVRGEAALAKTGLAQPGQVHLYLAYLAYELQRYEAAQGWITRARADGSVPAQSLDPLARAIDEALAARRALQAG